MASIGSYYITIMPDMSKFNGQIVSGLNGVGAESGKTFHNSFLDNVKGTALGVAVGNLVSTGFNQFMGGLSTGIERLDIIKNFPRVMENLGVDSRSAAEAVDRVQQALVGLPTSLQGGVQAVQRLTTSMGDVDRATDVFIAFNNALVAGAAPASLQASALEQFSQAVAKGKPDMLEWRSLMNAMPAQLEQVAQSMGMTSSELGEGLRKGDIAMDDFLDAIVALNETGVGEYGSFSEQVTAATSTIGTALTNVTNRIGAGWAAILDVIGQGNIADAINRFSTGIVDFMTGIASAFQWVKYTVLGSGIGESIASIGEQLGTWFGYFTEGLPSIKEVARGLIDMVDGALKWVADNGQTVSFVLGSISGVLLTIFAFNIAEKIAALVPIISGLFTTLMANPFMLIVGAIAAVVTGIVTWLTTTEEGRAEWQKFKEAIETGVNKIKAAFKRFSDNAKTTWKNIKTTFENVWNGIRDFFKGIWDKITSIFKGGAERSTAPATSKFIDFRTRVTNIWNAIKSVAETVWNAIKGIVTTVAGAIKSVVTLDFEGLRTSLGNIWNGIKTVASTVWSGIKSVIGGIVDGIKTSASNAWNSMKSTASTVWNGIKGVASTAWNGVKTVASTAWNAMKASASTTWNAMKTSASTAWNAMKTNASGIWNAIKTAASPAWNAIKDVVLAPIRSLRDGASKLMGGLQGIINGLTGKRVDVGVNDSRSKVSTIISGIQSRINGLTGKTVTLSAQENITKGVAGAQAALKQLANKTVWIEYRGYQSGLRGIEVSTYTTSAGNKRITEAVPLYAAAGGIATKATLGVWGEAGSEALIPLSNRSKVRPFARAVASEIGAGSVSSSVNVTGNTFYVRNDADIDLIAKRISLQQSRQMAGRL